jgi:hypothetical protein
MGVTEKVTEEGKTSQPMAEIYLKGGKSVFVPYAEANEYITANWDNLEYRKER